MTKRKPLGDFLRRALAGRSRAELARDLGISRSTVQRWATGKGSPGERFREALKAAALGRTVPPPPPQLTRSGTQAKTSGTAIITPLPGGNQHVHTQARSAFARELGRASGTGNAPRTFTVQLHGFRAEDSPLSTPARTRRVVVDNLTDEEIQALASGSKDALESVITRAIEARNYSGGFTFTRATRFGFDTT